MANVMKYWNGSAWVPVASQYIDPNYAYLKQIDNPSNRNMLYNGAMQVAQRGTSVAGITAAAGYYTADRWYLGVALGTGAVTMSVGADAPSGSGLTNSLKVLVTTAKASLDAGNELYLDQRLEGQDLQRLAKGTASAQPITLSFWVKSNVTGTFIARLGDTDNLRNISAAYTVTQAGVWERKTITYSGDATGAFANDNGLSLIVRFKLAAGSNKTSGTLQTSWGAEVPANFAVGQTNLAAATNNYWQITGVQLEVGPVATGFEFKSYGQELRECQRYYETSFNYGVTPANGIFTANLVGATSNSWAGAAGIHATTAFKVTKRTTPSITFYGANGVWRWMNNGTRTNLSYTGIDLIDGTPVSATGFTFRAGSPGTTLNAAYLIDGDWAASAEL